MSRPWLRRGLVGLGHAGCTAVTILLALALWRGWWGFGGWNGFLQVLGFVPGMWGVWLQALESHWNWPIQLVSSAVYVVVFFDARLFADTTENLIDVALYGLGWYWWLRGGVRHQRLEIGHLSWRLGGLMAIIFIVGSAVLTSVLVRLDDAAPLLDATTTIASLIATFLMGRKLLEAWWLWIVVNLVYIVLYVVRDLQLTAVLYLLFAIFSVAGLIGWQRIERGRRQEATAGILEA